MAPKASREGAESDANEWLTGRGTFFWMRLRPSDRLGRSIPPEFGSISSAFLDERRQTASRDALAGTTLGPQTELIVLAAHYPDRHSTGASIREKQVAKRGPISIDQSARI